MEEEQDIDSIMYYLLETFIQNKDDFDFYYAKESCPDWLQFIDLIEYDDPNYIFLLKRHSIENEIPREVHAQRFLIDMSMWDDFDNDEFDETYIHPVINILTENWKGDIEHFYRANVLPVHYILSSRLGYNIGHALAASLWTNLHENINHKRLTEENITKWRNGQKVKDVMAGLKYLINRGLDVVKNKDKFKGLSILQMIHLSDQLVKSQDWKTSYPTLLDEVKEMIKLYSVMSNNDIPEIIMVEEKKHSKKRKKEEEEYVFEEESNDEDDDGDYDEEEEEDYAPKKKKKSSNSSRKTSNRKKKK